MIFISYRVDDSKEVVEHLDTRLAAEFGRAAVFRDKKRLAGGDQWPDVLEQQAKSCRVMLVVIGAKWQTAAYTDDARLGQLRLHDTADWVRKEITLALDHGATVIPVLLNGQKTPNRTWLDGCDLGRLAQCQGVKLRTDEYDADFATLVETVRTHLPTPPAPPPPAPSPPPPPRVWKTEVQYALQPAPHFAGRVELLKELSTWAVAPNDPVRVRALVAAGGTGKTAVAERVLTKLPDENPFGVFVWSFYENPQTEAFLRAACEYFLGEAPKDTGGLLEHLQRGLRAADLPHLLILDGLELVQATGTTGRPRGELEDPLMKRFLRWLAAGRGTRAKALITSRFSLPDLADWGESGFRPRDLEDLDPPAARSVFRRRGVRATDAELDTLTAKVHGHALTVDVLGLYLVRFADGDPRNAEAFDLTAFGTHQKAERLSKVLTSYSAKLPNEERDLLARLSLFPRGVTGEWLTVVIAEGGQTAGALAGCSPLQLMNTLEGLLEIGLVFASDTRDGRTFSAHPFLRDFFRGLLGATRPEDVHEAVRRHLVSGLGERPSGKASSPTDLDRYERLIEVTRLAGDLPAAVALYRDALGGYSHLSWVLGENSRGHRILSGFVNPHAADSPFDWVGEQARMVANECALYGRNLGMLNQAREAQLAALRAAEAKADRSAVIRMEQDLTGLELAEGRYPAAERLAQRCLTEADQSRRSGHARIIRGLLGSACGMLGRVREAREHFAANGVARLDNYFGFRHWVWLAELRRMSEPHPVLLSQVVSARQTCAERQFHALVPYFDIQISRGWIDEGDIRRAREALNTARQAATSAGVVDVALRCYHLAAEIARHEEDYTLGEAEALDGIQLADSCGFGRWSLDIRTELAQIHLAANEPAKAIEPAEWVLKRSLEVDCQYAWGVADSLHLLGVAYSRLGEKEMAREHLLRAVEKRRPLEHPGLSESAAELARLG